MDHQRLPQTEPAECGADDLSGPAGGEAKSTLDDEAVRVANVAAELGVPVPADFQLLGVGKDGRHTAVCYGGPAVMRTAAMLLHRLDGAPVADCLAMPEDAAELDPKPEWAPPADWTDRDAMLAYLAERRQHPEWRQVYNGAVDWIALIGGVGAAATAVASVLNQRQRRAFAQYVADHAVQQGTRIDPAAVIRAFEGAQASDDANARSANATPNPGADDKPAGAP